MEPQTRSLSASHGKLGNLILIVLVIAAIVLGYFLYQRMDLSGPSVKTTEEVTGKTRDERLVLRYPAKDVTEEEWNNYLVLVAKLAVEADKISIGANCSVSPVVVKTPLVMGKKVTLENNDSVAHTISFNTPPNFEVPANGKIEMPVDFKGTPGIYGYGCDNSPDAVGLIQVLQ
jgi:hypothetical protein